MKQSKLLTIPQPADRMLPAPTHLRRLFVALVVLLTMTAQTAWAEITGDGSAENPYTINTATDWETFAQRVTNGETFEGKYVQLGDNFENSTSPITKTAGYKDKDFKGIFDGRGKTMYVNLSAGSTSDGQNVGLFGSISGATIQNVKVEGNITSNNYNLGTFAGRVGGTSTIKHCWSNATITSTKTADTDCGAMVGFIKDGTLNIIDCAFTGSIELDHGNGYYGEEGGGFAGWISNSNPNAPQISNCLFAPTSLKAAQDVGGHGYVFVSGSCRAKLDNCYYNSVEKESVLKKEGTDASSMTNEALLAALGSNWEISGDKVVPLIDRFSATVSGIKDSYLYTGNAIDIDYTVTALDGTSLTKGTHFTETIKKDGSTVSNVMEKGNYTLTISGKSPYFGSLSFNFIVDDYIRVVNTTTVMNNCPYRVQRDVTISDRIVIQGNVTLTLEEGCTLTAQQGIKVTAGNTLTIDGTGSLTIQRGSANSAGIGSGEYEEYGHIIINGGTINTHGNSYGAGIGGGNQNPDNGNCCITINGGIINASGGQDAAGIGGGIWGSAGKIVINGGQVTARAGHSRAGGIGKGYPSNDAKGLLTLDWTRESDFVDVDNYNISNINFVGKDFVLAEDNTITATTYNIAGKKIVPKLDNLVLNHATMNNLCSLYRYTGSEIALDYIIKSTDGVTTLVKGTDYSETIKKGDETVTMVKDKGEYTLTITGLGDYYTGTKSYTFSVADIDENLTQDGNEYYVNLPSDGSTKTVCLGENQTIKVYDSEGKSGNVVAGDGFLMLYAPEGCALEVMGKIDAIHLDSGTGVYTNSLNAYEGEDESVQITSIDRNSESISFASGENKMLLRFYTPIVYTGHYGLDLTVRVIQATPHTVTKGTCTNGDITIDKTSANTNETVTLTVNPASGYLLKRITITDTDNSTTLSTIGEDHWYSEENTVTFKMPNKNVTVTPEFTNDLTATNGLALQIDPLRVKAYTIPEIVKSFNITGSANNNSSTTAVLKAHEGYRLQATGNVDFIGSKYDDSEITIYDGANTSATLLTNIKGKSQEDVSISTQTSSSNYMTIYLYEDEHNAVFTGKISIAPIQYNIGYNLAGGSVATENPTTYTIESDAITLNNPTKDGYTFAGWTGTDLGAATTSVTIAHGSTGDRSYTATWNNITYNITYTNAVNGTDGVTNTNPTTYTIESEAITLVDPSKTGYVFAGWFSDAEFKTAATTTIAQGSTGDKTFWAKWTKLMTNTGITVSIPSQEWTGTALTPVITVKDGETTLTETTDYTVTAPIGPIQDVGDYTYTITGVGNYSGTKEATFTITKATPIVTAPTAIADLVYTGSPQALVTAGTTTFGSLLYSTAGSTYSADIPTGTDAGTYTVYYKVEGSDNWNAVESQTVEVTIAKADINPTLVIPNKTYDGEEITYTIDNNPGSGVVTSISWEKENSDGNWSSVSDTPKDAGKYRGTAVIAETDNYNGKNTNTAEFTIAKADITMTTAPAAIENLAYSGSAQTLITAGAASFGTVVYSLDGTTFSDALPQATDAGEYTVTYKVEGDANHNALVAASVNVTIAGPAEGASINIALTEEYGTYCSAYDLDFSGATGLTAYIAAGYNKTEHTLLMVKVTSVPKGTGLLLKSTSTTGGNFTATVQHSPYVYSNLLTGTTAETTVSGNDYILGKNGAGKVGFYRAEAGTLAAGKAYLDHTKLGTSTSGAPMLNLEFYDDATDIRANIREIAGGDQWYTLDGRKLQSKPTVKGLYILNGKKTVVR